MIRHWVALHPSPSVLCCNDDQYFGGQPVCIQRDGGYRIEFYFIFVKLIKFRFFLSYLPGPKSQKGHSLSRPEKHRICSHTTDIVRLCQLPEQDCTKFACTAPREARLVTKIAIFVTKFFFRLPRLEIGQ